MFFDQQQSYLFSHQSIIFDDDSTGNKRTLIKLTFQLSTLNSSTSVDRPSAGHTMVPWCPNEALSSVSRIRQYPHLSEQICQTTLLRLFTFLRSGLMKVPQTLTFLLNGYRAQTFATQVATRQRSHPQESGCQEQERM